MNADLTKFLSNISEDDIVGQISRIINSSLQAVDPRQVVLKAMKRIDNRLFIGDTEYDLDKFKRVLVVGIGKAAGLMTQAVVDILGKKIDAGIVIQKQVIEQSPGFPNQFRIYLGDHPVPGPGSVEAGTAVLKFLETCTSNDLVIFLISGGGSSLMTAPMFGISLDDLQVLTRLLLKCGAPIDEINITRKHLDRVKGGGLAKAASHAKKVSLVLSDVVGNPLDMIASGPTVADPTMFSDAKAILEKYKLWQKVPVSISKKLEQGVHGEILETCKSGDDCLINAQNLIVGSNYLAASAGVDSAKQEGFNAQVLTTQLQGDAFGVGRSLGSLIRQICETGQPLTRPACLIAGGETTVVVQGEGVGGRNLEVALGAVVELDGLENVALVTLATDGEDGPTDAAGAVVTGETYQKALTKGLQIDIYRKNNNSYHYFEPLDALLKIGATCTNVNDLNFLFVF